MTTEISTAEAAILAARHVSEFNDAVAARDFTEFLWLFTDDATVRFENVPGAGTLEFTGRRAYTTAYFEQPPDDQIDISGPPTADGNSVTVPFSWRRDGGTGVLLLTFTDGNPEALDERLVSAMKVTFG